MNDRERLETIEKKLDIILRYIENGRETIPPANSPMLYAYLEEWLTDCKAPKIKPKSLAVLRSGIETYIKPHIPDKPLTECRASEMLKAIENVPYTEQPRRKAGFCKAYPQERQSVDERRAKRVCTSNSNRAYAPAVVVLSFKWVSLSRGTRVAMG